MNRNTNNSFNFKLPASEQTVTFKLLTGWDDDQVTKELKSLQKITKTSGVPPEVTTRLRHAITAVDGNEDKAIIKQYVDNMLSRDSLALRNEISRLAPDIEMSQMIDVEGEMVEVDIPLTVNFFWPDSKS